MKNKCNWKASRYVYRNGGLKGTKKKSEANISSRLILDIVADFYNSKIKIYVKGKLLDLGCGNVPLYEAYKEFISENICVDWGNSLNKNTFLDYELDINKPLPFIDNEFDTIILSDVLEHIRKPELLFKEMYRVLNTGGYVLINVPFFYGIHEQPYDYFRFTKYALVNLAEDSGFHIVMLEPLGGSPEVFADLFSKHCSIIPYIGGSLSIIIQSITQLFLKLKIGKKISEKTAHFFPLGYKMVVKKEHNINRLAIYFLC